MSAEEFLKPKVVISKCIEFDHCRWNGNIIKSNLVKILKNYVEFHPVCAEVEIGLGVPRDPIRIIKSENLKLIQPSTMREYTISMESFAKTFLSSLSDTDGFIMKFKSPSCGLYETKYHYDEKPGSAVIEKGPGLFGKAVLDDFSNIAVETEARLTNFRIREHWLTKLFILRYFRAIKASDSHKELVEFHSRNKLLLMAYNQNLMRKMGRIVANPLRKSFDDVIEEYEEILIHSVNKPPNFTSHINVLMHALGYFKKTLSSQEKAFYLDELEKYRSGWIPLFVFNELIKVLIIRYNEDYLKNQTYFNPYPQELMNFDIKDTWRGRSYWKK
ncbi:MAG: YbgA family protein [Promethearchaeota archaeon]|jgi:uncharacterized protein YbgA (DUF1722 family)/uncharacterized protein YbbK (DUF523 family)